MAQIPAILLATSALHVFWIVTWLVLIAISFACLLALMLTRWGRSQPLRICVVLSFIAHLLLAGYAATIRIAGTPGTATSIIEVSFGEELSGNDERTEPPKPWERFPGTKSTMNVAPPARIDEPTEQQIVLPRPAAKETGDLANSSLSSVVPSVRLASARPASPLNMPAVSQNVQRTRLRMESSGPQRMVEDPPPIVSRPSPIRSRIARVRATTQPAAAGTAQPGDRSAVPAARLPDATDAPQEPGGTSGDDSADVGDRQGPPTLVKIQRSAAGSANKEVASNNQVPDVYQLRDAPDRQRQAGRLGGSRAAEMAVESGLRWLAAAQNPQGHWSARRWGGGNEKAIADQGRKQAGTKADTGMTGLALLAFLGNGHTHLKGGPYQDTVRLGLEYLAKQQHRDGSLSGDATLYAAMYCHGMATFAISEAYGMSGDERLRPYVVRAVNYTLAAQNSHTGGWRYRPGDLGDTSQLGWQVMALKSAEIAGVSVPDEANRGIQRFLASVSSGRHAGLACYRPGEAPNRTMTAEALVCRLFTGTPPQAAVATEAASYVSQQPPGSQQGQAMNLYGWYYATLALFQRQDKAWASWNQALQTTLIAAQRSSGSDAGSWNPDTVWGNYGGRVYSTAMATLCLEVYYRFLPLYGGNK